MEQRKNQGYNIEFIRTLLPHRYPFLMIDHIIESGPDYAIALKNISYNEPHFQGHFPGYSVMPATLITEACLQASAFIGLADEKSNTTIANAVNTRFFCVGFNIKFMKSVGPGDQLNIKVSLIKKLDSMSRVKASVSSHSGVIATGDLSLATQQIKE